MLKTIFLNVLKLLLAGSLIAWLVGSGKLDFSLLIRLKDYPTAVAIAIAVGLLNLLVISCRWLIILQVRSSANMPLTKILQVTWIGQFFSSVLPGSVSGDLVKMLYVQSINPDLTKRFVFASILIDRLMGLSGLILLVGISSLFFSSQILEHSPAMGALLKVNFLLALLVIASLLLFFFGHTYARKVFVKLGSLFLPKLWGRIIVLWDDLTAIKTEMIKAVSISLVVQFLAVVQFWTLIHPFVGEYMNFREALAFIPIGLMTLALPVAPSGLGVGHAIFQKLFQFSGIENGASLFNLFFFVTLILNLIGVVPWLISKRKN
jgi:uncharacterized membrane protein YbhN (UPF0104 family)